MRTRICHILWAIAALSTASPAAINTVRLTVTNPTALARSEEPVVVSVSTIQAAVPGFTPEAFAVSVGTPPLQRQVACQADDLNGDGKADEIAFQVDLPPNAQVDVAIASGPSGEMAPLKMPFPKRAHASFQKKYEGMGWESDRVAWRLYFDPRNAIDLYGKIQHAMALDYFAQPGVNYHAESPIGRDIYKNGDALGLGSIGALDAGKATKVGDVTSRQWKVLADGPVRAIADLIYTGWKVGGKSVDITSRLTIWAGQHWFEHRIRATNADGVNLITSLPLKPGVSRPVATSGKPFFLATWGHQVLMPGATAVDALPDQNLGLACVFPTTKTLSVSADPGQHIVALPVANDGAATTARWWIAAGWDQEEPDGPTVAGLSPSLTLPAAATSQANWTAYCEALAEQMNNPAVIKIAP